MDGEMRRRLERECNFYSQLLVQSSYIAYRQFSSTRRLPSRLFSSTRRLFGSPSPSPTPVQITSSVASLPGRTSVTSDGLSPPSQLRRLAEFATVLGDCKLAVMVWEALRKESKGGSVSFSN